MFPIATGGGGGGMPGLLMFNSLKQTQSQQFQAFKEQPLIKRDLDYFTDNIKKIESADDLLNDFQMKKFLLEAFGLEEDIYKNAFIKKILTDDLGGDDALAYKMRDTRYADMATALRLDTGTSILKDSEAMGKIGARWLVNGFEKDLGEQNVAVREAMYFRRQAPKIKDMYQVLGDRPLRKVAFTIAGLPEQIAAQPVEKQKAALEQRFKIEDFKEPVYVDNLMRQFLAIEDAKSGAGTSINAGVVALLQPAGAGGDTGFGGLSAGFSLDLMV
ncbi:MAG: DUF1217 domain-containing protein [Alphaproteobacteria bacterium]|jgi:hypothetical protein|nr:DUF1217 domain-containing protein [Alphaproteobacteria bacterium]